MKAIRVLVTVSLVSLLPCLAGSGCTHNADADCGATQIPRGGNLVWNPQVSRDRVVWVGNDGSFDDLADMDIFTWTPDDGVLQLTENDTDDLEPRVFGDRVVWMGDGDVEEDRDYEIFTWTPTDGVIQLTENESWDMDPEVSGDRVVWRSLEKSADSSEIFTWTPAEGILRLTENNGDDREPQVSGDRVVWMGDGFFNGERDYEIFTWTRDEGITQLTENDRCDEWPRVSGNRVVWSGGDDGVFTWTAAETNISTAVVQVSDRVVELDMLQLSDDRVVWCGFVSGNGLEIFTWTPAEGILRLTENNADDREPQVSGDRVVWTGQDSGLFTWTAGLNGEGGVLRLANDVAGLSKPQVSGDRVVWSGRVGDSVELFSAVCRRK